jgi:hypothetical protein
MRLMSKTVATVVTVLVCTAAGTAAPEGDPKLTPQQQEKLDKLKTQLEALPVKPESADEQLPAVQENLNKFLALTNRPSREETNKLASTLVRGINGAVITVPQSVGLSKEIAKILSQPKISYQDTFKFTAAIDPYVQGTALDTAGKMRLYRQALRIVQTAPNFSYNQK